MTDGDDYWPNGRLYTPPHLKEEQYWTPDKPRFLDEQAMAAHDATRPKLQTVPPVEVEDGVQPAAPGATAQPMQQHTGPTVDLNEEYAIPDDESPSMTGPCEIRNYTHANKRIQAVIPIDGNRPPLLTGYASAHVRLGNDRMPVPFSFPLFTPDFIDVGDAGQGIAQKKTPTLIDRVLYAFEHFDYQAEKAAKSPQIREQIREAVNKARGVQPRPGLVDAMGQALPAGG